MKVSLELQPMLRQRSGIGIYTYEMVNRLHATEDIAFIGNAFNFLDRNDNSEALQNLGMPLEICHYFPYGVYRRIWKFCPIPYEKLFPTQADVYHFFNYIVPPGIEGRIITTVYDMTAELYPETMDQRNLQRLRQGLQNSIQRAERIITISESSKRDILRFYDVPESSISIVYPSFSVSKRVLRKETLRKWGIDTPYVLYVGNLEPRKNITSLITAFYSVVAAGDKNLKLVVAGRNAWNYAPIHEKVAKYALSNKVIFTGAVSEEEKTLLYSNAEVFVFPSLYEGFGIPILEAQQCGVPVIASNTSSMPEAAGDGALFVNPKQPEEIMAGILAILESQDLRNSLIQKGYENVKRFSWEKSATEMMSIYRLFMNGK